jgi:hypothetical protein
MFNLNSWGYLAYNIPLVAHFARLHTGQRSKNEDQKNLTPKRQSAYIRQIKRYRLKLMAGITTHVFRNGGHNVFPVTFSNTALRRKVVSNLFLSFKNIFKK